MLKMQGSLRHRSTIEAAGASRKSRASGVRGTRETARKVFGPLATGRAETTGTATTRIFATDSAAGRFLFGCQHIDASGSLPFARAVRIISQAEHRPMD
jgi:hypothetical protein